VSFLVECLPRRNLSEPLIALKHRSALIPPTLLGGCPGYPDRIWFSLWACSVVLWIPAVMRLLLLATWYLPGWLSHSRLRSCHEIGPPLWQLVARSQMQIALDQQVGKEGHARELKS